MVSYTQDHPGPLTVWIESSKPVLRGGLFIVVVHSFISLTRTITANNGYHSTLTYVFRFSYRPTCEGISLFSSDSRSLCQFPYTVSERNHQLHLREIRCHSREAIEGRYLSERVSILEILNSGILNIRLKCSIIPLSCWLPILLEDYFSNFSSC